MQAGRLHYKLRTDTGDSPNAQARELGIEDREALGADAVGAALAGQERLIAGPLARASANAIAVAADADGGRGSDQRGEFGGVLSHIKKRDVVHRADPFLLGEEELRAGRWFEARLRRAGSVVAGVLSSLISKRMDASFRPKFRKT